MLVIFTILFLCILGSAQSQWVETGSIPGHVIALSPDGTTAMTNVGIYTKIGNSWNVTQPITTFVDTFQLAFLSTDGSSFAYGNLTCIDIYTKVSPTVWNVSSTIYATSLGLDEGINIIPSAATFDGQTMIVSTYDSIYPYQAYQDFFVLRKNSTSFTSYVLQQRLNLNSPYNPSYPLYPAQVNISADGSTLAFLWASGNCDQRNSGNPNNTPIAILSRNTDGNYEIVEELDSFLNWSRMAISVDGKILVGFLCDGVPLNNMLQLHFFSWVEDQYEFMSKVFIGGVTLDLYYKFPFCISSDASIIFTNVFSDNNSIAILKRTSETDWSIEQNVTISQSGIGSYYGYPIFCTMDGSTMLVDANDINYQPITYIYTGQV